MALNENLKKRLDELEQDNLQQESQLKVQVAELRKAFNQIKSIQANISKVNRIILTFGLLIPGMGKGDLIERSKNITNSLRQWTGELSKIQEIRLKITQELQRISIPSITKLFSSAAFLASVGLQIVDLVIAELDRRAQLEKEKERIRKKAEERQELRSILTG